MPGLDPHTPSDASTTRKEIAPYALIFSYVFEHTIGSVGDPSVSLDDDVLYVGHTHTPNLARTVVGTPDC
eukprot:8857508-Pyramimonas_sp.AAC.1